jgi:putative oxidoreductase
MDCDCYRVMIGGMLGNLLSGGGFHDGQSLCAVRCIVPSALTVVSVLRSSYRKFSISGFDVWWGGLVKQGYSSLSLAYTVAAEFAGALLLLLGIYSRYVSLLALPVMIAITYHWMVRKGFWFTDGGVEFPLAWTMMLITQAILGDGAYAVRLPVLLWERRVSPSAA